MWIRSWCSAAAMLGVLAGNGILLWVRGFARRTGLQTVWWDKGHARDRAHLRRLVATGDGEMSRKARLYLRMDYVGWALCAVSILLFLLGV
jgi:hypothetical protein